MTEREKVIEGLSRCCGSATYQDESRCDGCPYDRGGSDHCEEHLMRDALKLIETLIEENKEAKEAADA